MSDERLERMQDEFMERHRDADEIVIGKGSGVTLAAVYYSPKEKLEMRPFREFFQAVEDAEIRREGLRG